MTSTALDFYFDFSSPYGYFAALKIDELAAKYGRSVDWKPVLLGALFKVTGGKPLPQLPLKGDYARHDMARSARFLGIPFKLPLRFPVATVAAARLFYWANDRDPKLARELAKALYRAYFVEDRDISSADVTVEVAIAQGLPRGEALAALDDPAVKDRLRREVDAAIARGVFGSPYIVVGGEPFWGVDRLDQIERWLKSGAY
jgi:2-hydroxychromene-2-carboxylate isomerase